MSILFAPTAGPGPGIHFGKYDMPAYNRTGGAVAVGDVLQLNFDASDAAVSTIVFGATDSIWANAVAPDAGGIAGTSPSVLGVVVDLMDGAGADNTEVRLRVYGICDAFVIGASGSMAIGTGLVATTAKNFDIVTASGEVIAGMGLEAVSTPTTRELGKVFVNGFATFLGGATG